MTAPADTDLRERIVAHTRALLPRLLRREVPVIAEDARLMDDLGLTSSATLELLLELEERLEIQINVEDIDEDNAGTVGKLADFIVGHRFTDE
jgi:acyl carrier protein